HPLGHCGGGPRPCGPPQNMLPEPQKLFCRITRAPTIPAVRKPVRVGENFLNWMLATRDLEMETSSPRQSISIPLRLRLSESATTYASPDEFSSFPPTSSIEGPSDGPRSALPSSFRVSRMG